MGLGLFIAKTLLERTGAEITFVNGRDAGDDQRLGAIVTVAWPRSAVSPAEETRREPLGRNRPIEA